ncbi:MAG: glycerol-3-phosphate 1-O-acyltransferase PlsY [Oscillospiraceae bacterium]|nr:glycerol-3-phosphate 1-O-acyltransferase PlsY [Oscillospiraceae bacterium]
MSSNALLIILCAVASYFIGSLNSSIIVVRLLKHEDIRNYGSKNAGLTNTLRCFGKGPALATLISDLLKGSLTIILVKLICSGCSDVMAAGYISGFMIMLGHIFPVYYRFKGGKGVLLAASVLIAVDIQTFAIVIPIFIIMLFITRYVSLSSITAAVSYPVVTFIMQYFVRGLEMNEVILHTVLVAITSCLIIYMHKTNISRLKNGTENKFSFSKSKKEGE